MALLTKQDYRRYYLTKRASFAEEDIESASEKIRTQIFNKLEGLNTKVIHTFIPKPYSGEPDILPLLELIKERYPEVILCSPVIVGEGLMEHRVWKNLDELEEGVFGILEPKNGDLIDELQVDLILVPLIVADVNGNRLGYGKGFYDRFLAKCRANSLKWGISLFPPLPTFAFGKDKWDVPLNHLFWGEGETEFLL